MQFSAERAGCNFIPYLNDKEEIKTENQIKMEWKAITLSENLGGGEWSLKKKEKEFKAIVEVKTKFKTTGLIYSCST